MALPHIYEPRPAAGELRGRLRALAAARGAPEVGLLVGVSALLNLWALSRNGWANVYYSAAVRSMAASWHNFLYASFDPSGVMTVDKPPLFLWIQTLSVRVFGFNSLAILVPQALMGVASVLLVHDLVRRRFGRLGGFAAGLALATTPIFVAMSRDNNPDALLTLCCLAAVWFAVRAFEDGRTRWIVLSGVAVGLGFETKMLVALVVVPGIVLAWLWIVPGGRRRLESLRQLLWGGAAMLAVGGAWPLLVALTPAGDRPWVSGTADNSILSLIFGYNGLGRVTGQNGGPAGGPGGAGGVFAEGTGPFRLINAALGGQGGWLLGLALAGIVVVALASRGRRRDQRSAWLAVVGGAFVVTAVLFSFAHGIFHPYYVVLLAPFTAAVVGAGVATVARGQVPVTIAGPLLLAAGVACELLVRSSYSGQLTWMEVVLPLGAGAAAVVLLAASDQRVRATALSLGVAVLLIGPAIWAADTLGYATQSTFPAGGPATDNAAVPGGGFAGRFFGAGGPGTGGTQTVTDSLTQIEAYVNSHGGGPIAVDGQTPTAADAILASNADVAGIGGFSGQESDPSIAWLANEVAGGHIRWVYTAGGAGGFGGFGGGFGGRFGGGGGPFGRPPGGGSGPPGLFGNGNGGGFVPGRSRGAGAGGTLGSRPGARAALSAVEQACTSVASVSGLYDCRGRAAALRRVS